MARNRRYKVKVRFKVRKRSLGLAGGAALAVFLAVSAVYGARIAWDWVSPRFSRGLIKFRLERPVVEVPAASVEKWLAAHLESRKGEEWTRADLSRLLAKVKTRYPYLKDVSVSRNYLTGALRFRAGVETVVAPALRGGAACYLGESGRLFPEIYPEAVPGGVSVSLPAGPDRFPSEAAFLARLNALSGLFDRRPLSLSCPHGKKTCRLALDDGSEVLWGGFEFTRAKILRLNEVLERSASRLKGPYKVDLRYFEDGRAVVSSL
ncbi:MAG TPA: hypothetical protein PKK31_02520 [Elusimicrobiales bacterium]|nr:hypothetical protein [Elusimicrobiales bacterium]